MALVSGDAIPDESHKLLAQVHYSADLTQMQQGKDNEIVKTSQFLMGIAMLVIIGCSCGGAAGILSGRRQGALPGCAGQAGVFGVRGRIHPAASRRLKLAGEKNHRTASERLTTAVCLWKKGRKP